MSSVLPPIKGGRNLRFPSKTLHTSLDNPSLVKETSTVGDLISFADLTRRLSPEKPRRLSFTSESGISLGRRKSIRRSESTSSVGTDTRRHSIFRSDSNNSVFNDGVISKSPPLGAKSRRLSHSMGNLGYKKSDEDDNVDNKKKKTLRGESMMELLRDDLEQIPCLDALKNHPNGVKHELNDTSNGNAFNDANQEEEMAMIRGRRMSRRQSSLALRCESRKSSNSNVDYPVLTEAELRKLRMIQTLNKMNGTQNQRSRKESLSNPAGEVSILEASFAKGKKRGSIATHVLFAAQRRNPEKVPYSERDRTKAVIPIRRNSLPGTASSNESEELQEKQKESAQKIFQMLKKPEKPKLPPVVGIGKEVSKEEAAKDGILSFRRRLKRKKTPMIQIFRKKAKFLVLLLRSWKIHSNAINESLVENNESLDMMTRGNQPDLMFDVTQYKAVKEAKVSQEARRILSKKPKLRTDVEKHYLQVFLRNYKSIAEYPVNIQKMIVQRSWIESFDSKRVIVREGHVPMCFYFLLSGSAVVSVMEGDVPRTVMFLNRGDSFGDVAILNKARRQTTVISREKIELLVMTDEDFVDIFMSGGMRDPDDPFLKSINFLNGWPREKLIEQPKKCIFSYFKRGTVLVSDSSSNEWIFVIKSGSASILKKLQTRHGTKPPMIEQQLDFREEILELTKHEDYLSHEEQIQMMFEEEKRGLDDQNLHVRFYALPEINVPTNEGYNELKQMKDEYINANSMSRALGALEKLADAGADIRSEAGNSDSTMAAASAKKMQQRRKSSIALLKGPFMHKLARDSSFVSNSSRRGSFSSVKRGSISRDSNASKAGVTSLAGAVEGDVKHTPDTGAGTAKPRTGTAAGGMKPRHDTTAGGAKPRHDVTAGGPKPRHYVTAGGSKSRPVGTSGEMSKQTVDTADLGHHDHIRKVDDWQNMSLPSLAASPINDLRVKKEPKPVFVEVQALTKGQVFGMTEMLFDNQPNFSLVSNGAECIMIEKKFFLENASQALMVRLKENTYPYPSNEALQENLESQLRWDKHKKRTLENVKNSVKIRKANVHDSRGLLKIPIPVK